VWWGFCFKRHQYGKVSSFLCTADHVVSLTLYRAEYFGCCLPTLQDNKLSPSLKKNSQAVFLTWLTLRYGTDISFRNFDKPMQNIGSSASIITKYPKYSEFRKSLCTYKRCWKWCPRASKQAWACLILIPNNFCSSAFGKSLCTYKSCSKWCPWALDTDKQIYLQWRKCTATFRTHCTVRYMTLGEGRLTPQKK
jgi:hypothetical protein